MFLTLDDVDEDTLLIGYKELPYHATLAHRGDAGAPGASNGDGVGKG